MINICFIADNKYVLPTMTAIKSLVISSKTNKLNIYVLSNNICDEYKIIFKKLNSNNCNIDVIEAGEMVPHIAKEHLYVTKTALLKFFLPQIFDNLDKILYLDSDVVVKRSVETLYNTDISNVYAGVVADIEGTVNNFGKKLLLDRYFNSGVMLLNLNKMREEGITDKLLEYKKSETDNSFMDQNVFNAVFNGNVKFMPPNYNYMIPNMTNFIDNQIMEFWELSIDELNKLKRNITILHLTNVSKPWENIYSPSFEIYLPHLLKVPNNKLKTEIIKSLYKQNPKRFIKYLLKQNKVLRVIIKIYESIMSKSRSN